MKNNISKEDLSDIAIISAYFFTEYLCADWDEYIDNKAELQEIQKKIKNIDFQLFKKEIIKKIDEKIQEIETEDDFWR